MKGTIRTRVMHAAACVACVALLLAITAGVPVHAAKVNVKGEIRAAADLNPDSEGRPSPVVLMIFQLKAPESFRNADFFSLYAPDAAVLGADLVERSQILVRPGSAVPLETEFDEEARYVGFVAAFRDIENAQWRGVIELPQKGFFRSFFSRSRLLIELDSLALSVKVE